MVIIKMQHYGTIFINAAPAQNFIERGINLAKAYWTTSYESFAVLIALSTQIRQMHRHASTIP